MSISNYKCRECEEDVTGKKVSWRHKCLTCYVKVKRAHLFHLQLANMDENEKENTLTKQLVGVLKTNPTRFYCEVFLISKKMFHKQYSKVLSRISVFRSTRICSFQKVWIYQKNQTQKKNESLILIAYTKDKLRMFQGTNSMLNLKTLT